MSTSNTKRQQVFVDQQVQGAMFRRVVSYWLACVLVIGLMITAQVMFTSQHASTNVLLNRTLQQFGPALVAAIIVLPFILLDCVRITNKFAGPVNRLRQAMAELAAGRQVEPLKFRENDFWAEVADGFNQVLKRVPDQQVGDGDVDDDATLAETVKIN